MILKAKVFIPILFLMILSCKTENNKRTVLNTETENTVAICNTKNLIQSLEDSLILSHIVNPKKETLKFYWKNNKDSIIKTFKNLKTEVDNNNQKLVFAMNGGMFKKDFSPQGLYIEKGETLSKLDTIKKGFGNFYLQPNGVFLITKNGIPLITTTQKFNINNDINYATQSGPMLVIDGKLHSKFNKGSSNLNIRNGVGTLPNGDLLFAMSKNKINFYDFATFFKNSGCENALYLDGFVSKTYLPSKNCNELKGDFGVIIAETKLIK